MPAPKIPTRLLYPRKEAAFQLGISVRSLDYLIASKELNFQKIGKRVLIHWKELQRFAASNHYEPWCLPERALTASLCSGGRWSLRGLCLSRTGLDSVTLLAATVSATLGRPMSSIPRKRIQRFPLPVGGAYFAVNPVSADDRHVPAPTSV